MSEEKGVQENEEQTLSKEVGSVENESQDLVEQSTETVSEGEAPIGDGESAPAETSPEDQEGKPKEVAPVEEDFAGKLVYSKSYPKGAFPGDTLAAQNDLCAEAAKHLLATGKWATEVEISEDLDTVTHMIVEVDGEE